VSTTPVILDPLVATAGKMSVADLREEIFDATAARSIINMINKNKRSRGS
jgi:hypothetical protein